MTLSYIDSPRRDLVKALEKIHGPDCFYCDEPLNKDNRTIDHVVSQSEGKRRGWERSTIHGIDNLRLACRPCNALKGDRDLDEEGNIVPRPISGRKRRKQRPDVCTECMSGRKLLIGQTCPVCDSGPMPERTPTAYKSSPKVCQHGHGEPLEHCWICMIVAPELRLNPELTLATVIG